VADEDIATNQSREKIRKCDKNRWKWEHGEDWLRSFEKKVRPDHEAGKRY
jgi:hypothetical protein